MIKRTILRATLAVAFAIATVGCGGGDDDERSVVYEISGVGTNRASITYSDAAGGTRQSTVQLPHGIHISGVSAGDFLYISAQNDNASGTVTVEILVDGRSFRRSQSSGAYVIATASGSCC